MPRARTSACCVRPRCAGGKAGRPILVGRPSVVEARIKRSGLRSSGQDFDLINPEDDPLPLLCAVYIDVAGRRGVTPRYRAHGGAHQRHVIAGAGRDPRRGGRHDLRRRGPLHEHLRHVRDIIASCPKSAISRAGAVIRARGYFMRTKCGRTERGELCEVGHWPQGMCSAYPKQDRVPVAFRFRSYDSDVSQRSARHWRC